MRKKLIEPAPVQGALDLGPELTDWMTAEPARPGWYDLRGGPPFPDPGHVERAFYDGRGWYGIAPDGKLVFLGAHEDVRLEWRGLASKPANYRARLIGETPS